MSDTLNLKFFSVRNSSILSTESATESTDNTNSKLQLFALIFSSYEITSSRVFILLFTVFVTITLHFLVL